MKTTEAPWYAINSEHKRHLTDTFSIMHQKEQLYFKLNQDLSKVYDVICLFKQSSQSSYEIKHSLNHSKILYDGTAQLHYIGGNHGPNNL